MAKLELTVTATSGTLDVTPDAPVVLTVLESVGPRGPRGLISVDDTGGDGSLTYDSGSGELTYTGPSASEVRAHFSGGTGVTITDGEVAIGQAVGTSDNVTFNNVDVDGDLTVSGTTTTVNTETINLADNQITLNSNATGSATENAGIEIERGDDPNKTLIWNETDDKWTVGSETFVAGTVEANLTGDVTGTVSSLSNHDTGDLAEGTNLYYTQARFDTAFDAKDTDDLSEGVANQYYTDARSRAAISVTDAGGDGSLAYNSTTGVITFTGPSAAEVRAHLSAGGDLSYDSNTGIISFTERTDAEVRQLLSVSGDLSYNNTTGVFSFTERTDAEVRGLVSASGDLSYNSTTGVFSFTERTDAEVRGLVSATDAGGDGSFSYDSATGVFTYTGPSATEVRSHFTGGTGVTITNGDIAIGQAVGIGDSPQFVDLTLSGDLTVNGSTTTIDTTNLAVEDSLIELSSGLTAAAGNDAGLIIERGTTGDNAFIGWDEAADKFTLGTTTATGVSTGSLTVTTGTLVADIEGDVTGTVSSLSNHDTGDLAEGTNLYYTDARADARVNLQTGANLDLSSKTTSDLAEGTNLYYTDARADARVNTANVTAAGALMDSEVTNLAQVKAFDSADYATAAQGATADTAVQPNDSPTFGTITADGLSLGDNEKIQLGASNDLQIYHSGTNSFITEAGPGDLNINAQNLNFADGAPNFNYYFRGIAGQDVRLYYNGSQKLNTTSTGVDVTGNVVADGLTVSGTSYIQSTTQPQLEIAYNSGNITGFYRSGGDFQIKNDNGAGTPETSILLGEDGAVTLYYDDAAKLATTSTGVDVTGTVTADDSITISRQSVAPALFFENSSYSGGDAAIKMFNAGQMVFETDATSQMVLDANGNVGIGTTNPADGALEIADTSFQVALQTGDKTNYGTLRLGHFSNGGFIGTYQGANAGADVLRLGTDGTERMRIDSSGNVGIGTTTPATALDVTGTVTADGLTVESTGVTNARIEYGTRGAVQFAKSGTLAGALVGETISGNEVMYFGAGSNYAANPVLAVDASNQRAGIGNASPATELDVTGTVTADQYDTDEALPTSNPSLSLDFANAVQIDPRINFSRGSIGTYFDGQYLRTAGPDEPRIEYAADGTVKGLLIEELRENLVQYSNALSQQTGVRATLTENAAPSPSGSSDAGSIVDTAVAGDHRVDLAAISVTSGTTYTASFFLKANGRDFARVQMGTGGFGTSYANFDLSSNSVGTTTGISGTSITDVGNGWYRCGVTATATATASTVLSIQLATADNTVSYTGDGTSGIYVYGAQLEQGSFATSYIPTNGSTATREPDIATVPVSEFNYNTDAGTVVVEGQTNNPESSLPHLWQLDASVSNTRIACTFRETSGAVRMFVQNSGSTDASLYRGSPLTETTEVTTAGAWQTDDVAFSYDGSAVAADTNGCAIPLADTLRLGLSDTSGTTSLNGHIRSLKYWPQRLSDATLQAVTQG